MMPTLERVADGRLESFELGFPALSSHMLDRQSYPEGLIEVSRTVRMPIFGPAVQFRSHVGAIALWLLNIEDVGSAEQLAQMITRQPLTNGTRTSNQLQEERIHYRTQVQSLPAVPNWFGDRKSGRRPGVFGEAVAEIVRVVCQ